MSGNNNFLNDIEFEEKRAATDACCPSCGSSYEVFLLIPGEHQGGNCRRTVRYYDCENCSKRFRKYDVGFAVQQFFGIGLSLGQESGKKLLRCWAIPVQLMRFAFSTRYSFRAHTESLQNIVAGGSN